MIPNYLRRRLALFQLYRFLSTSYLFAPVLIKFFVARGLSITEITLLNTVYCATAMLFEVPTGVLADRWGRRRAMVLGALMMAAGCLIDFSGHGFVQFALGEGLLALGMTLSSGADSAYLYDLLRAHGCEPAYPRLEGIASAAKLLGAAAALCFGDWVASHSVPATYLVTAGVCIAAAIAAALLQEAPYRRPEARPMWHQIVQSSRLVLSHRPLGAAVLFSALLFSLIQMKIYFHPAFLTAIGVVHVGWVMALLSLGAAAGARWVEPLRRWVGDSVLLWGLPALLAISYGLVAAGPRLWAISLLGVQCFAGGVYSPFSKTLINRTIRDSGQRATILSIESMARRLLFGLLAPLVGLTIDRAELSAGLMLCAALAALIALGMGVWHWAASRQRSEETAVERSTAVGTG